MVADSDNCCVRSAPLFRVGQVQQARGLTLSAATVEGSINFGCAWIVPCMAVVVWLVERISNSTCIV